MGVVAVFATILIPLLFRRSKKLFFDVVCEALLVEQKKEDVNLPVNVSGVPRALFVIDLRNPSWGMFAWLGGLDIAPSQYEQGVSFSFGEKARILEADVVEENPSNLNAELVPYHFPPDRITLKPLLLNQGDSIRIKVVADGPTIEPYPSWFSKNTIFLARFRFFSVKAEGRILGIKKVERKRSSLELLAYATLFSSVALLPMIFQSAVGIVVWLLTGDPVLFLTAPVPFVGPSNIITGIQTALLLIGQILLIMAARKMTMSRKISNQYSSNALSLK